jgi:NitT/TauT family transport system substrate-binding protein
MLDGRIEGPSAPFLVAQQRGYFEEQEVDVSLEVGANPLEPITRIASGAVEMGFADINMLIRYRDQNPAAPVKAVFVVYNTPPFAILARKSRGITEPKQLENKRVGAPGSSVTRAIWPIFAKINDIDIAKVTLEDVSIPVRGPMLAAGQLDAVLGYSFRVYVDLKDRGVPLNDLVLMQMASFNLKLYGSAIMVNTKFAAEKPEAVRGVLLAYLRGLKDTIRSPATAVDAVIKREASAKKEVELDRLRMAIRNNILTKEVRANGFGAVDLARLEESINQIGLAYTLKAKPKVGDIFDAGFLPPASDRRVN